MNLLKHSSGEMENIFCSQNVCINSAAVCVGKNLYVGEKFADITPPRSANYPNRCPSQATNTTGQTYAVSCNNINMSLLVGCRRAVVYFIHTYRLIASQVLCSTARSSGNK